MNIHATCNGFLFGHTQCWKQASDSQQMASGLHVYCNGLDFLITLSLSLSLLILDGTVFEFDADKSYYYDVTTNTLRNCMLYFLAMFQFCSERELLHSTYVRTRTYLSHCSTFRALIPVAYSSLYANPRRFPNCLCTLRSSEKTSEPSSVF